MKSIRLSKLRGGLALAGIVSYLAGSPAVVAELCVDQPASGRVLAHCGVVGPEDLVNFENRFLLISAMDSSKRLFYFDLSSAAAAPLDTDLSALPAAENWADPSCVAPELLSTHGLDLSRRADGAWQLLAVNHAERESIEFFEVLAQGAEPTLRWRGCVMAAENAQFNDVAALPDGGFLATDPITASLQLPRMLLASLGMDTGRVYRWRPTSGYETLAGAAGAYPNGILLAEDGESFYLNLYLDNEVREYRLDSGELLRSVSIQKPDNLSRAPDGRILLASHDASLVTLIAAVTSPAQERNNIPFTIFALDPESFEASVLFASDGSDLGGGTTGEIVGDSLYIGAFHGDRLLEVDLR